MNYQNILKELRTEKNLNQEDIANFLGIARITYNHYENKEKIIPIERLNDLTNLYHLSIDYLLGLTNNKTNYDITNNEINIKTTGIRLKEIRKENKLTQLKLAKFLNTTQSVIVTYEQGKYLIPTSFIYAICKKYNISADYLLGKTNSPKYLK